MSSFKKLLLICLSVLLVFVSIPALFFLPAENIMFRASSYQKALIAQKFYEKVPGWATQLILGQSGLAGQIQGNPVLFGLNHENLEGIFRQLFPPEILEVQGDLIIQQVGSYLNFQSDELIILLDLRLFKERFNGPGRELIVQEILRSWPACSAEQLVVIAGSALMGNLASAPICRPPDEFMPLFENLASQMLGQFISGFPDQVYILSSDQASQLMSAEVASRWQAIWTLYRTTRFILRVTPLAVLFIVILILLFNVRSLKDSLSWLGWPILASGVLVIVFAGGILFSGNLAGRYLAGQLFSGAPEQVLNALVGAFIFVFARFSIWSILAGGCAILVGGILSILSRRVS